jgi:hypothetical protein
VARLTAVLLICVASLLLGVFAATTSVMAAPSAVKSGCPVITRAQAAAVLGAVRKLLHHTEHIPGVGGGVTWLRRCIIRSQGGEVQVAFAGNDRQSFDEERRGRAAFGRVKILRGLGKAAYLFADDPSDLRSQELYVFHPSKAAPTPGAPPLPGEGQGDFAILPDGGASVRVQSLVALANAVLKHPIRPLSAPGR